MIAVHCSHFTEKTKMECATLPVHLSKLVSSLHNVCFSVVLYTLASPPPWHLFHLTTSMERKYITAEQNSLLSVPTSFFSFCFRRHYFHARPSQHMADLVSPWIRNNFSRVLRALHVICAHDARPTELS